MRTNGVVRASGRLTAALALLLVLVLLAAVVPVLAGCGSSGGSGAITENDNGKAIDAKVGDTLTVSLKENPTTGYAWRVTSSPGLVIKSSDYKPDDTSGQLAGSGGVRTWTLQVTGSGKQSFSGVYWKSWERKPGPTAGTFGFTVEAR